MLLRRVRNRFHATVNQSAIALLHSVYVRIATSALLVFGVGCWGMLHELESIRRSVGKSQVSEAKSHAERTVERLQQEMEQSSSVDLGTASNARWLRDRWRFVRMAEPRRAYRAIVDSSGMIVAHSNNRAIGKRVNPPVESQRVPEFGDEVFESQDSALTGDLLVLDILIPIFKSNSVVGNYHVGVPVDWLNKLIANEQSSSKRAWITVIAYTMSIVLLTGIVLHRQGRHANLLERKLHLAEERRLQELSTLMVGMAHEVRNPLNSIRLNLHTTDRIFRGKSQLGEQDVSDMLSESVREIERVESLIGQLLGYARIENDCDDDVIVADEIQSAIQFMKSTFERQVITVVFRNDTPLVTILINRRRLRQILLNLMKNAADAMPDGGRLEVTLETIDYQARLVIADSGKGVDEKIRSRLFEPFVTTKESGTGMGLAIVRSMIDNIGGAIEYQISRSLGGAEFILTFPIDRSRQRSRNGQ